MRTHPSIRRSPSPFTVVFLWLTALLFGGGGLLVALFFLGAIDVPFLRAKAPARPEGVPVPLNAVAMSAHDRVTRDHLNLPKTGEPAVVYLSPDAIKKQGLITDPGQVLGRVLKSDRAPGFAFRESDFLPKGTRPGLVGGIPPGMVALVVEASRVQGVHWLKEGDRFDLLANEPAGGRPSGKLAPGVANPPARKQAKVLAQGAFVVQPVAERPVPKAKGGPEKKAPPRVLEVTLAVRPSEAAQVSEALAGGGPVVAVPRSGRPEETSPEPVTVPADPVQYTVMEVLRGSRRETLVFPTAAPPAAASPSLETASK